MRLFALLEGSVPWKLLKMSQNGLKDNTELR